MTVCRWAGLGLLAGFPGLAFADAGNAADTSWLMTATALVLLMVLPGLALFYGGLVNVRNVLSVWVQCFAIACVVSLLWLICGFSLAFSDGGAVNGFIGGLEHVGLAGISTGATSHGVPLPLFVLYEMTFAIITPALVVGGFAERMSFAAVVAFTSLWSLLVYLPVCHWIWGGGWLQQLGVHDFAGGLVVHTTAGVAALVAALKLKPRDGFFEQPAHPHNLTMTLTGAGLLWVGWFGFNGGSALAANTEAARAMLATHMAAASGACAWMLVEWYHWRRVSALGLATGVVAGLGTITPAAGYVSPLSATLIGLLAGVVCFYMVKLIKQRWFIDDALDVFPVHGIGGMLGSLLLAVFAINLALPVSRQLLLQGLGILAVVAWTATMSWLLLSLLARVMPLRVPRDIERNGLDNGLHGERGYHF